MLDQALELSACVLQIAATLTIEYFSHLHNFLLVPKMVTDFEPLSLGLFGNCCSINGAAAPGLDNKKEEALLSFIKIKNEKFTCPSFIHTKVRAFLEQ
jgi:hypothetical protein